MTWPRRGAALALLLLSSTARPQGAAGPGAAEPPKGAPAPVGEKRSGQTADEVALRDQAVLIPGGAVTLELAGSYARAERDFGAAQLQQRSAAGELAARLGVARGVQLSARLPWRWREAVATATGDPPVQPVRQSHHGLGDVALGLYTVLLREGAGRPNLVLSLEGIAPSGPGDAGAGAGLAITRSYDPVVLFAGASWMYGLRIDAGNPDRVLARHNVGFQLGYAFAVNESVALSGRVLGSFRDLAAAPSGFRPPREQYRLQLGLTYLVSRRVFAEPTVTMGLGTAAPDVVFGLSLPVNL